MFPGNAKCSMTSLADTEHILRERKIDSAGGGGGGGRDEVWNLETMFLQLAWWSMDNCSIFPTVNIFRLLRSKKRTGRGNEKCLTN